MTVERLVVIALVAVGAWTVASFLACLWVAAAMRRDDDVPTRAEDDVQPWDSRTVTLADGVSVTVSSGGQATISDAAPFENRWQN